MSKREGSEFVGRRERRYSDMTWMAKQSENVERKVNVKLTLLDSMAVGVCARHSRVPRHFTRSLESEVELQSWISTLIFSPSGI